MSAKLESAQGKEGAEDSHNPEPYNDLAFLPTQLLEVVMQRRSSKDAVAAGILSAIPPRAVLEHVPLQEDGQRFGDEHEADEREDELCLQQNGHGAERAAQRERAGVAHEDLRGVRIVPEKSNQSAHHRQAEDRELSGALQVEHPEIAAQVHTTDDVREDRE